MRGQHPQDDLPPTPRRAAPLQGMHSKGTVPGSHARTPSPRALGQRAPTARSEVGQQRGAKRLTSDAPCNGARHPPRDALPPTPQRATPAHKSARSRAGGGPPSPDHQRPGNRCNGALLPAPRGRQPEEAKRLTPRAPHQGERSHPPPHRDDLPPPRSTQPLLQGMHANGTVPGPQASKSEPTAGGQQTLTARPGGRQPGEDTRLTSDVPGNSASPPPPPGTPCRHPNSAQCQLARAHAVGLVLHPHTNSSCTPETPATGPGCPHPGTGGPERESACHQMPLTTVRGHPSGDNLPPPPRRAAPARRALQ